MILMTFGASKCMHDLLLKNIDIILSLRSIRSKMYFFWGGGIFFEKLFFIDNLYSIHAGSLDNC